MTLSIMDWFCGAGGSSQGIDAVPGVEVILAANHWELAIRSHAENFPGVRHEIGDIRELDVQNWPVADGFWASPECTKFSSAQGVPQRWATTDVPIPGLEPETDEAADRSRALMWDVPKYLEGVQRRGKLVKFGVVENVVEAFGSPQFPAWSKAMRSLGYKLKIIALNSMHAQGTKSPRCCQSRNRGYGAYVHKSVKRTPDWDKWLRPRAHCHGCDSTVSALQVFKRPGAVMGSYGPQYLYRCPKTSCRGREVVPPTLPALSAIDLSIPATRIGDRAALGMRRLADNTLERIRVGAERFWLPLLVPTGGTWRDAAAPLDRPMPARTTRECDGVALPELLVPVEGRDGKAAAMATQPGRTQTARNETGVALPPYLLPMRGGGDRANAVSAYDPLRTVSAEGNHHALIAPMLLPYYSSSNAHPADEPMRTLTTRDRYGLVAPAGALADAGLSIEDVRFRMLEPAEIGRGMAFRPGYVVLGSKRHQVRQYGNAVTPCAAELIVSALTEAVTGEALERRELTTAA